MSIVGKVLTLFLGNKEERDLKEINPYVGKIQQESALVASLSNDGLRERTAELKREVRESIAEEEKEIAGLRAKAESEIAADHGGRGYSAKTFFGNAA